MGCCFANLAERSWTIYGWTVSGTLLQQTCTMATVQGMYIVERNPTWLKTRF